MYDYYFQIARPAKSNALQICVATAKHNYYCFSDIVRKVRKGRK